MECIVDPHTVRCERAPLRDVQNERSALQKTASSVKVCEVHTDQKENVCESSFITDSDPNLTFKSFLCAGGEVEISDGSHLIPHLSPLANTGVTPEDAEGEHRDHPYCRYAAAVTQEDHASSDGPSLSLVAFTSSSCSAGEVQVTGQESVVAERPDLKKQSFADEDSDKHTEFPRPSSDHLYYDTQTPELRSGNDDDDEGSVSSSSISVSKNATDVTFKSFTCPGGDVEVVQRESLIANESEVRNIDINIRDEHTQLLRRHFVDDDDDDDGDGDDGGGSVTPPSTSISENATDVTFKSFTCPGGEVEIAEESLVKTESLMQDESLIPRDPDVEHLQSQTSEGHTELPSRHFDHPYCNDETVTVTHCAVLVPNNPERVTSDTLNVSSAEERRDDVTQVQQLDLDQPPSDHALDNEKPPVGWDVQVLLDVNGERPPSQPGVDGIPSNAGSSETQNVQNHIIASHNASAANARSHVDPEVLRSESVDTEAQMKMWSHLILSEPSTPKHSAFWLPDSPIPPPQLHSTVLTGPQSPPTPKPAPAPAGDPPPQNEEVMKDFSGMGQGPLQDQLRKMGELLIAASGKFSAPAAATPVQQHSACVWTTPTRQQERSTNTSALMEEKKETDVSDACTSTDSLLWSVSRSNLKSLSRSELEQKMISTLIMVEVLSQQLTSAQNLGGRTEPGPSSLRDRLVQTERTELSQTGPYRELYISALERIQTLEIDQETFHGLHQAMQLISNTMMSIKSQSEEALGSMKELEGIVTEDQEIHSQQLERMKALCARCMDTLKKMEQKNKVCVKDRDDMKQQMEEALEKESTVLRVLEQLRVHHTTQVSDLQCSLGSHEELTDALTHTYPQLVEVNRMHMDSVIEANTLLKETLEEHTRLSAELHAAQQLLQRTHPLLHKLQQRASAAIEQSHRHQEERTRAVEDREQMEQQLYDTHSSLQEAQQQIADLQTQITIMSSEMAVLREQLTEVEDERSQLQRKATELSATVSSSLASYAFLEQTLASETSKLQRSLHDTQEATERADSLQSALCESEKRLEVLESMMEQRENLISELGSEIEHQQLQLRRLTQVHGELCDVKEINEFLQAENELTREQLAESEGLLRSHLQGLRERNLECEDLRVDLQQLRVEKECVEQELVSTRDKARLMLLDQGEQLAQATLDTSLLLQRVCAVINHTHTHTSSDGTVHTDPSPVPQSCSSFLNSVINALTEEQPCATVPPTNTATCVQEEDLIETIGSKSSAFTRITPADLQNTTGDNGSTILLELLSSLGESVSELHSAIERLKQHKDSEIHTLHTSIRDLQEELEAQRNRHTAEGAELKLQLTRLKGQVEKDAQVLQQKTQDEKALRNLCSEMEEKMEAAQKHRAENNELRREGAELRRTLQQSQVEVQALRAELTPTGQSESSRSELEDRICLLREVEKLKANLMEVERSRSKMLERAKRHQMVHAMNQTKLERELHLLDDMIETVRKALSSVPDVVSSCPELQKLLEYLG